MSDSDRDKLIDELLAREEIRKLINTYSRGLDRCDAELVKSVFHDDAIMEHATHYNGNAHAFCDEAVPLMASVGPNQHFLCNEVIEIDGDVALAEVYGLGFQTIDHVEKPFHCIVGVRILDRVEKREGVWKIAHRRNVLDWNLDIDCAETWGREALGPGDSAETMAPFKGAKDKTDPSYPWFAGNG